MNVSQAFNRFCLERIHLAGLSSKTAKNYNGACSSFCSSIADLSIVMVQEEHILNWKLHLMNSGLASSTISKYIRCMKAVLLFMQTKGVEVMNPQDIEIPGYKYKAPTYVYSDEVNRIILVCTSLRDKALFSMLFSTGCRISELLNIDREDVQDGQVMVTGKNGSFRPVYIDEHTQKYLSLYLDSRKDPLKPLFVSAQNRRIHMSTVQKLLHTYASLAGIDKNVTPHTFRHGFATDLLLNGADIRSAQVMLGHKNISTTQIYTHLANPHTKKIHEQFHSK